VLAGVVDVHVEAERAAVDLDARILISSPIVGSMSLLAALLKLIIASYSSGDTF
jgi:hypothetical protein